MRRRYLLVYVCLWVVLSAGIQPVLAQGTVAGYLQGPCVSQNLFNERGVTRTFWSFVEASGKYADIHSLDTTFADEHGIYFYDRIVIDYIGTKVFYFDYNQDGVSEPHEMALDLYINNPYIADCVKQLASFVKPTGTAQVVNLAPIMFPMDKLLQPVLRFPLSHPGIGLGGTSPENIVAIEEKGYMIRASLATVSRDLQLGLEQFQGMIMQQSVFDALKHHYQTQLPEWELLGQPNIVSNIFANHPTTDDFLTFWFQVNAADNTLVTSITATTPPTTPGRPPVNSDNAMWSQLDLVVKNEFVTKLESDFRGGITYYRLRDEVNGQEIYQVVQSNQDGRISLPNWGIQYP